MLVKRAKYFIFHHKIYIRAWECECWFLSWQRYSEWEKKGFRGEFFKQPSWMSWLFWTIQLPFIIPVLFCLTLDSDSISDLYPICFPLFLLVAFEFDWLSKKWKYLFHPKYSIHGVLKNENFIG